MSDAIRLVILFAMGIGLYRMGWWHGYAAAQREYMETLKRQEGKNWYALMKGRMRKEESDAGKE